MNKKSSDKKATVPVANGVEQVGLTGPRETLRPAGAQTLVVSPGKGDVKGWKGDHPGDSFEVAIQVAGTSAGKFDALLLPGGVFDPDHLRCGSRTFRLVRGCADSGKPIGTISPTHGARSSSQYQLF